MAAFPFLFGGTFIEAKTSWRKRPTNAKFPFLFGGTFIEALHWLCSEAIAAGISLPFRRDFH